MEIITSQSRANDDYNTSEAPHQSQSWDHMLCERFQDLRSNEEPQWCPNGISEGPCQDGWLHLQQINKGIKRGCMACIGPTHKLPLGQTFHAFPASIGVQGMHNTRFLVHSLLHLKRPCFSCESWWSGALEHSELTRCVQPLEVAMAAAVAGPPTLAFDATRSCNGAYMIEQRERDQLIGLIGLTRACVDSSWKLHT